MCRARCTEGLWNKMRCQQTQEHTEETHKHPHKHQSAVSSSGPLRERACAMHTRSHLGWDWKKHQGWLPGFGFSGDQQQPFDKQSGSLVLYTPQSVRLLTSTQHST